MQSLILASMRRVAIFCLLVAASFCQASDNELPAKKLAAAPTIDGTINEAEWQDAATSEGAYDEDTGANAVERMRFWLAYDENYIYFAAKLYDSEPTTIKATEYRTNVSLGGDDNVALLVDLSGSLADFNQFAMNAKGATSIYLAGGRAAKREWSGEFVAQGQITSEGWEVEARIPWQIMRLPAAGPRTVRFNVEREHKRHLRDYVWRYTGSGNLERHGRWIGIDIPKSRAERTLKLLPYGYLGGADRKSLIANAGMDLKTNITNEIVAVGSISPDFRNIENSILSLDFSRFERLAGETRPFFQEGSDYLNSALYASQRIPNFDAGINVHGKLSDKLSFGALNAIDFGKRNSFVTNFSYNPTATDSYRMTVTSRTQPGEENNAYLLRYNKIIGPYSFFLRNMGTRDSIRGDGSANTALINYNHEGLGAYVQYDTVSPNFLPRLGFAPEVDLKGVYVGGEYQKAYTKGTIQELTFSSNLSTFDRFSSGFYRRGFNASVNSVFRNGISISMATEQQNFEGVQDRVYQVAGVYPRGNPYGNASLSYTWGRLEMEDYKNFGIGISYKPIRRLQLSARFQHVDHFEKNDLGILGWNYDLGRDNYISGRAVKRDSNWNAYVSFRKSGNRGVEYYLILGDPNAQKFRTSLILKVIWPIEIKLN